MNRVGLYLLDLILCFIFRYNIFIDDYVFYFMDSIKNL